MSVPSPPPSPASGLNVIALVSGGKDSLYSILHCLKNGHRVVALANLHPANARGANARGANRRTTQPGNGHQQDDDDDGNGNDNEEEGEEEEEEEDLDSFMYQTIGHSVIPLYEAALGIPLYRAPITGAAVDTARIYRHDADDQMAEAEAEVEPPSASGPEFEGKGADSGSSAADETESLIPLLRRIQAAHPHANAVSAGAILSTYQRTRIENVAARLGLTPLAWLWMYPELPPPVERMGVSAAVAEAGLLEDMAACGCEARIIKVASGGLDWGFLWGDLAGLDGGVRRRVVKGMRRFAAPGDLRGAVLGEGGEYESLALDGPGWLWKRRIEVEGWEERVGEGGVGYVRLKGVRCVDKLAGEGGVGGPEEVRRPMLLDERFAGALEEILSESGSGSCEVEEMTATATGQARSMSPEGTRCEPYQARDGGLWHVSNITAPEAGPGAAEQMGGIVRKIETILRSCVEGPRSTEDIVFTTVLLRSMADFASMNTTYVSLFKKPNPPARATVACGDKIPEGVHVMVSLTVDLGPRESRQGLHVQSRSYWAPANIGPYSQAMSVPMRGAERVVYIAGQIPLDPASMEIVRDQTTPERQMWPSDYSLRAVLSLQHLWRIGAALQVDWWLGAVAFLTGTGNMDAKARVAWRLWETIHKQKDSEDEEEESALDAWDIKYGRMAHEQTTSETAAPLPNFNVLQSDAAIPPFLAVKVKELPRGSDIEWQGLGYCCTGLTISVEDTDYGRRIDTVTDEKLRYTCVEIEKAIDPKIDLQFTLRQILAAQMENPGSAHAIIYATTALPVDSWPGQIVPCESVWGQKGRRLAAGIIFQNSSV
ncbi:diphthine--ammonia ligase family protein [Aspergillus clavatus NRRL 1]|uniref:Diphthine--ammonia ligase n=1 Tax=Aspergillus clavatus (strain ATCC 1007 / CBS 513.65 / DSM 816 / NCTC 3887 / NRRL 1 / QM 1276 / 107) TaxID=344612 RepID=A1CHL8_ASPCL|nr:ATP binding L-PSP endoribonuclease family protein, putative [Aspergillus clavatus NRRL 1]EAW10373.1 ATP binding L-PSP endoribonuclease family protein, putative [Aspergillus clavatus NRRL 1]